MTEVTLSPSTDVLRSQWAQTIAASRSNLPQAMVEAVDSLITAIEYDDRDLMRSNMESVRVTLAELINENIQQRLSWPKMAREMYQGLLAAFEGQPITSFQELDEVGRGFVADIDQMVTVLAHLQTSFVALVQRHGGAVPLAPRLRELIDELQQLKNEVVRDWPWLDREWPAVDRAMVAASMQAIQSGEGESIDALIRRLSGDSE